MNESTICIQLGQCGNQLGYEFYSQLADELGGSSIQSYDEKHALYNTFFREPSSNGNVKVSSQELSKPIARSILVDMEPKVIDHCINSTKSSEAWSYDLDNILLHQSGSGNNWMYGFREHGPNIENQFLEIYQHEVEKCDSFNSVLLFQSLAGGTGSGVGTYISEVLRDYYSSNLDIINTCVWPYQKGEVVVQSLNAALSIAHLSDSITGFIVLQNEQALRIAQRSLHIETPSLHDINRILAEELLSILLSSKQSVSTTIAGTGRYNRTTLSSLASHLFSNPDYKLSCISKIPIISMETSEFEANSWNFVLNHTQQLLLSQLHYYNGIDWRVKLQNMSYSIAGGLVAGSNIITTTNNTVTNTVTNTLIKPKITSTTRVGNSRSRSASNSIAFAPINLDPRTHLQNITLPSFNSLFPVDLTISEQKIAREYIINRFMHYSQCADADDDIDNENLSDIDDIDIHQYFMNNLQCQEYQRKSREFNKESVGGTDDDKNMAIDPRNYRSYSGILTLRGIGAEEEVKKLENALYKTDHNNEGYPGNTLGYEGNSYSTNSIPFLHSSLWSSSNINPLIISHSPYKIFRNEKSASIWSTSQKIIEPLEYIVSSAWELYSENAFIHHYEKYGLDRQEFETKFVLLESILNSYKNM